MDCATKDAVIYYTLDDSCPCQNTSGRAMLVAEALPLDGTTVADFIIAGYKEGMDYSDRLTIHIRLGQEKIDLGNATVKLSPVSCPYDGKAKKPAVSVTLEGKKLVAGTDYTVTYANNTKLGTATATITGKGIYGGKRTIEFEIVKGNVRVTNATKQVLVKNVAKKAQVVAPITVNKDGGTVTYANAKGNSKTKKWVVNAKTGKVTVPKGTKKGTYKVTIKVTAKGNDYYLPQTKTYTATIQVVTKYTQPMVVKGGTATVSYSKTKAVTTKAKPLTVSKAQGKVTYKKAGGSSAFTVNATTGKVTVKKGTKKGTYTIKVKVTAAGNANYASGSKTVSCKVTVK